MQFPYAAAHGCNVVIRYYPPDDSHGKADGYFGHVFPMASEATARCLAQSISKAIRIARGDEDALAALKDNVTCAELSEKFNVPLDVLSGTTG